MSDPHALAVYCSDVTLIWAQQDPRDSILWTACDLLHTQERRDFTEGEKGSLFLQ